MAVDSILREEEQKAANVRATYEAMVQWPYWNEVFLNCVKESPLSYEAFAQAVQDGDSSPYAGIVLYTRQGFLVEGKKTHAQRINGEYVDEYLMAKLLPSGHLSLQEDKNN